jgi:hypothetical protein
MPQGIQMQRCALFSGTFLLAVFAISTAYAAKPSTPTKQLEKDATHIVVGKVQSISSSTQHSGEYDITNYIAEIAVDKIEKGDGLETGDVVHTRYKWTKWRGIGTPPPGDPGHRPTPNEGDSVRVYLVNKGYNGAGYTTDGGYDVYYNNGFEILTQPTR